MPDHPHTSPVGRQKPEASWWASREASASLTSGFRLSCLFLLRRDSFRRLGHAQIRRRPVARRAARLLPFRFRLGPFQPPHFRVPQSLLVFPRLRRQSRFVRAPAASAAKERQPVALADGPAQVPALLALLLAEPFAGPSPPLPPLRFPPASFPRTSAAGLEPQPLPLAFPIPFAGALVRAAGVRGAAGPALLWLRAHLVPRGALELAGAIPDAVAQPDALAPQRER